MDKVTEDMVSAAVVARDYAPWQLRECSICGAGLHYVFGGVRGERPRVGYDPSCDCSPPSGVRECGINELADCFNRQTPDIRARMWAEFATP